MDSKLDAIVGTRTLIIGEVTRALDHIDPQQISDLINAIMSSDRVFCIAVGRVMLALQALAKRLAHLGISVHCVGDINEPAITANDLLIVASGSGESIIPLAIARKAKTFGAKVAHIGSSPESSLREITNVFVRIPVKTKLNHPDELDTMQAMTTIFDQALYLLGDMMSMIIAEKKCLTHDQLWHYHANLE
jgi:6-phospho-3-hexuloisomerase